MHLTRQKNSHTFTYREVKHRETDVTFMHTKIGKHINGGET